MSRRRAFRSLAPAWWAEPELDDSRHVEAVARLGGYPRAVLAPGGRQLVAADGGLWAEGRASEKPAPWDATAQHALSRAFAGPGRGRGLCSGGDE
jgi:hypothetical protein